MYADDVCKEDQLQCCLQLCQTTCDDGSPFQIGYHAKECHNYVTRNNDDDHPELEHIKRHEGKEDGPDQNLVGQGIEESPERAHCIVTSSVPSVVPIAYRSNHVDQTGHLHPDRIFTQQQYNHDWSQQNACCRDDVREVDFGLHARAVRLVVYADQVNLGIEPLGDPSMPLTNQLFTRENVTRILFPSSTTRSINVTKSRHAGLCLLTMLFACGLAHAQNPDDYTEYYHYLRFTPLERIVFCSPVDTVESVPLCYGVRRDTMGRVVEVARFRNGNIDNSGDYSIVRFSYRVEGSGTVEERTYHLSNGAPVTLGKASIVEVLNRPGAGITMRSLLNAKREPVDDSARVSQAFTTKEKDGSYNQQWFVSNGKQQKGTGSDPSYTQFGTMPPEVWFRRFGLDSSGSLAWERVYGFDRKPLAFSRNVFERHYSREACDLSITVSYFDDRGRAVADTSGVHSVTTTHDRRGNLVEEVFRDLDGNLVVPLGGPGARILYRYRAFDDLLEFVEYYDGQGRLTRRAR